MSQRNVPGRGSAPAATSPWPSRPPAIVASKVAPSTTDNRAVVRQPVPKVVVTGVRPTTAAVPSSNGSVTATKGPSDHAVVNAVGTEPCKTCPNALRARLPQPTGQLVTPAQALALASAGSAAPKASAPIRSSVPTTARTAVPAPAAAATRMDTKHSVAGQKNEPASNVTQRRPGPAPAAASHTATAGPSSVNHRSAVPAHAVHPSAAVLSSSVPTPAANTNVQGGAVRRVPTTSAVARSSVTGAHGSNSATTGPAAISVAAASGPSTPSKAVGVMEEPRRRMPSARRATLPATATSAPPSQTSATESAGPQANQQAPAPATERVRRASSRRPAPPTLSEEAPPAVVPVAAPSAPAATPAVSTSQVPVPPKERSFFDNLFGRNKSKAVVPSTTAPAAANESSAAPTVAGSNPSPPVASASTSLPAATAVGAATAVVAESGPAADAVSLAPPKPQAHKLSASNAKVDDAVRIPNDAEFNAQAASAAFAHIGLAQVEYEDVLTIVEAVTEQVEEFSVIGFVRLFQAACVQVQKQSEKRKVAWILELRHIVIVEVIRAIVAPLYGDQMPVAVTNLLQLFLIAFLQCGTVQEKGLQSSDKWNAWNKSTDARIARRKELLSLRARKAAAAAAATPVTAPNVTGAAADKNAEPSAVRVASPIPSVVRRPRS